MSRSAFKKDKHKDVMRGLAAQDLQLLLGAEPHLAKAFRVLARCSKANGLRTFCKEGVSYTVRRVGRIKEALRKLDASLVPRPSFGLDGLIKDARRAAARAKSAKTDAAILAAIERISHFGLAAYTTIDRYLRLSDVPEVRRILLPSTKEKREAIGEMSRMARKRLLLV